MKCTYRVASMTLKRARTLDKTAFTVAIMLSEEYANKYNAWTVMNTRALMRELVKTSASKISLN